MSSNFDFFLQYGNWVAVTECSTKASQVFVGVEDLLRWDSDEAAVENMLVFVK